MDVSPATAVCSGRSPPPPPPLAILTFRGSAAPHPALGGARSWAEFFWLQNQASARTETLRLISPSLNSSAAADIFHLWLVPTPGRKRNFRTKVIKIVIQTADPDLSPVFVYFLASSCVVVAKQGAAASTQIQWAQLKTNRSSKQNTLQNIGKYSTQFSTKVQIKKKVKHVKDKHDGYYRNRGQYKNVLIGHLTRAALCLLTNRERRTALKMFLYPFSWSGRV